MSARIRDSEKNEVAAETRILNAAKEIFSEKGYDAASIAEIAKRANVNKALPYYYFESKSDLLKELVRRGMQEVIDHRTSLVDKYGDKLTKENVIDFYGKTLDSLKSKKDIMRIILVEALKGSTNDGLSVMELFNPAFDKMGYQLEGLGVKPEDLEMFKIEIFFFNMLPKMMFLVFGDQWAEFSGIDIKKAEKDFFDIYIKKTYKLLFGTEEE